MTVEQRMQILSACVGLGFREILMRLDKFMKGGGTDSIEELFQQDFVGIAKAVIRGDFQSVLQQIEKCGDSFEVEGARLIVRTWLCNEIEYAMKKNNRERAEMMLRAFRVFDKGFYTDRNPMPSFKADLFEVCMIISK